MAETATTNTKSLDGKYRNMYLLYSTKRWKGKNLVANLVNLEQFAKVLLTQIYIIKLQVD